MKSVLSILAKSVLLPLGLSAGMSAVDAATTTTTTTTTMTAKKSGTWITALIISNEQKGEFRRILLGILANKSYKSRWRHN